MRKILLLHQGLGVGGAEKMRLMLLRNMQTGRYNIKVCCIAQKGHIGAEIQKLGYQVDELGLKGVNPLNPYITYRLLRYIIREKPYILHSSLFNVNFHGRIAGFFSGTPHLLTEEHGEHRSYKGLKFIPYLLADFLLSGITDYVICCSDRLKKEIINDEGLPTEKVVSIENCLDESCYRLSRTRDEVRKAYNIASDELVFIEVANLKEGKGHIELIGALKVAKASSGCSFKCLLAGEGPLEGKLRQKCRQEGLSKEVIFLGVVENIADYLNASDVFVLPSSSEGLSIALMEAMLMGLACIASDTGSNPDLIKTGFNGIVFTPKDANSLVEAVIFCLKNKGLIRDFGERSKTLIKSRYASIDKYAQQYCEVWRRCGVDN